MRKTFLLLSFIFSNALFAKNSKELVQIDHNNLISTNNYRDENCTQVTLYDPGLSINQRKAVDFQVINRWLEVTYKDGDKEKKLAFQINKQSPHGYTVTAQEVCEDADKDARAVLRRELIQLQKIKNKYLEHITTPKSVVCVELLKFYFPTGKTVKLGDTEVPLMESQLETKPVACP